MRQTSGVIALHTGVVVAGATGIAAQTLLLRELLTMFGGNELTLGMALGVWLLCEAGGSWLASRTRPGGVWFAGALLGSSAAFALAIVLAPLLRSLLGLTPGQIPGMGAVALISLVALLPVSLAHGATFTLALSLAPRASRGETRSLASIYALETAGTLLGGLILGLFLLNRLTSIQVAFGLLILNSGTLGWLAISRMRPRAALGLLALGLILTALFALGLPNRLVIESLSRCYAGNQVRHVGNSHYSSLLVLEREGQTVLLSDGVPAVTSPVPDLAMAEEMAHIPMLCHPHPSRVLLVGQGVAGLLSELNKYPGVKIDYIEPDPEVISLLRRFFPLYVTGILDSPRISVKTGDVRRHLQQSHEQFDLVLIGLQNTPSLQSNRYFTREFYQLLQHHLAEGGILATMTPGSRAYVGQELQELVQTLCATLASVFPSVRVLRGDINIYLAARSKLDSLSAEAVCRRMNEIGITTRYLTQGEIERRFQAQEEVSAELDLGLGPTPPNTDLHPVGMIRTLINTLMPFDSVSARYLHRIIGLPSWCYHAALAALILCWAGLWRGRYETGVRNAVTSSGFSAAAGSLIVLLGFQIRFGVVYHHLVLLTTAFTAGTALGGIIPFPTSLPGRPNTASDRKQLWGLDLSLGLPALVSLAALRLPGWVSYLLFIGASGVLGILLGREFILANRIMLAQDAAPGARAYPIAARLYAADLFGGFLGAVFVPVLLVPALGLFSAALWVLVVKAASALMLLSSRRDGRPSRTKTVCFSYQGRGYEVEARVCDDVGHQVLGKMFSRSKEPILFVFPTERPVGIHMLFVFQRLLVVWFDREGRVVKTQEMKPFVSYARAQAQAVLELPLTQSKPGPTTEVKSSSSGLD